jgi:hypothetical protein
VGARTALLREVEGTAGPTHQELPNGLMLQSLAGGLDNQGRMRQPQWQFRCDCRLACTCGCPHDSYRPDIMTACTAECTHAQLSKEWKRLSHAT